MLPRTRILLLGALPFALVLPVIAGSIAGGCGENAAYIWTCEPHFDDRVDDRSESDPCCQKKACCEHPLTGHTDLDGHPDPCCIGLGAACPEHDVGKIGPDVTPEGGAPGDAGDGGDGDAPQCTGQCVPFGPLGWSLPALLWFGPEDQAPSCPDRAPINGYEGHSDLVVSPMTCGTCSCSASTGSCALPAKLTANTKDCNIPGGISTPFNAPSNWNGSCTAQDAIPAGKLCNGVPCVASLTIEPMTLTESGCTASSGPPSLPTPTWTTFGRACLGKTEGYFTCKNPGELCAPTSLPPPPGVHMCIFHEGKQECPKSYPDQHFFYNSFNDSRGCNACACGAPTGNLCAGLLTIFADTACTVPIPFLAGLPIATTGQTCLTVQPPGLPLGSKGVAGAHYQAGTCTPSGGEATGSVDPDGASTFCCLP